MEVRKIGELGLIARSGERLPAFPSQVIKGMGEDAAVSILTPGNDPISGVELLVQDVHFNLELHDPSQPPIFPIEEK